MVQAMIEIPKKANQVLNIVKAKYGFKTKSEAIAKVVIEYGSELLEPELCPEYIKKLKRIKEKGEFLSFDSADDLKKSVENEAH